MDKEHTITGVYCLISDWFNRYCTQPVRTRGPQPKLGDDEVLTMEILGELWGIDSDKAIHRYFYEHWRGLFPTIGHRTAFLRQSLRLCGVKEQLHRYIVKQLNLRRKFSCHIVDGFPISVCTFSRRFRLRLYTGEARSGYCAAKQVYYYGLKGHLLITDTGVITGCTLTPANVDERGAAEDFIGIFTGLLLGDKGYIGCSEHFADNGIVVETPYRSNMIDARDPKFVRWMRKKRKMIETVISQLSQQFHIQTVRARDMLHCIARIGRKILSHTLGIFLNAQFNNQWLKLADL